MIRVLDSHLVNQIAAGEVVERPASVVKELVENSLDAGARRVDVVLGAGGLGLVRVSDDGAGMGPADARLCVERHATSKIREERDLFALSSFGFRGEALPSIASVSRFRLRTRRAGDEVGTELRIDGGAWVAVEEAGGPVGTEITVRDLFFNVPARRKFVREPATEQSHAVEMVAREAMVRPAVAFRVETDGRVLLDAPATGSPAARAVDLLGSIAESLRPVDFRDGALAVEALLSPVGVHRGSAVGGTYLYVNGRWVDDPLLRKAVREAYRGVVPQGRHPVVVVALSVPGGDVDVNVHPAKTEVRFRHGPAVLSALVGGLRAGLERTGLAIAAAAPSPSRSAPPDLAQVGLPGIGPLPTPPVIRSLPPAPAPAPAGVAASPADHGRPALAPAPRAPLPPPPVPLPRAPLGPPPVASAVATEPPPAPFQAHPDGWSSLRVIGVWASRFVLVEAADALCVLDPRGAAAALARVALDALESEGEAGLAPVGAEGTVDLGPAAARLLAEAGRWRAAGLDLQPFGPGVVRLAERPKALGRLAAAEVVAAALACVGDGAGVPGARAALAAAAGAAAPTALSAYECRELLRALDRAGLRPADAPAFATFLPISRFDGRSGGA